jgi:hypothetical protein
LGHADKGFHITKLYFSFSPAFKIVKIHVVFFVVVSGGAFVAWWENVPKEPYKA